VPKFAQIGKSEYAARDCVAGIRSELLALGVRLGWSTDLVDFVAGRELAWRFSGGARGVIAWRS